MEKQAARETTGMFDTYRKLLDLLAPRERRRFYLLLVMIVGMGILQMLTVASILPLMFVLQHPAVIETNALLSKSIRLSASPATIASRWPSPSASSSS